MNNDEKLLKNYHLNENILKSKEGSCSDKANAWRKQLLLMEDLGSDKDPASQFELLKHQTDKLYSADFSEKFIKERVQNVEALLKGFKKINQEENIDDVFAQPFEFDDLDDFFEPNCHSNYESCINTEVTAEHLALLREEKPIETPTNNINNLKFNTNNNEDQSNFSKFLMGNGSNSSNKVIPERSTSYNRAAADVPSVSENENNSNVLSEFRTAREELIIQKAKKNGGSNHAATSGQTPLFNYGQTKKSLGARRTVRSGFVPPIRTEDKPATISNTPPTPNAINAAPSSTQCSPIIPSPPLANIDPKMVELITNEIMHQYKPVSWDDIAGLEYAKSIIKEAVVYPLLRPDIFTGLRRPPRGILLFGPPGTGKTLIGKCIASQSKSTFFSISASSLTSKWIGDGEKMVRALFAVATVHQPSVVFIDEIDSLLSQRSESEHESSRRLKNEFLVQLDGAATSDDDRILIVGATNRPQELDEAARRRLVRRLYIPLPEHEARVQILKNLLKTVRNSLSAEEIQEIGEKTDGYSGADMDSLCREASMEPIRSIPAELMAHFKEDNVRPVNIADFQTAIQNVRPSVSPEDLKQYLEWNRVYGAKR